MIGLVSLKFTFNVVFKYSMPELKIVLNYANDFVKDYDLYDNSGTLHFEHKMYRHKMHIIKVQFIHIKHS